MIETVTCTHVTSSAQVAATLGTTLSGILSPFARGWISGRSEISVGHRDRIRTRELLSDHNCYLIHSFVCLFVCSFVRMPNKQTKQTNKQLNNNYDLSWIGQKEHEVLIDCRWHLFMSTIACGSGLLEIHE